jgi:hypothetical protein
MKKNEEKTVKEENRNKMECKIKSDEAIVFVTSISVLPTVKVTTACLVA